MLIFPYSSITPLLLTWRMYSYYFVFLYLIFLCNRCPNAFNSTKADRGQWYIKQWAAIYLKHAHRRLQRQIKGFDLTIEDLYRMQHLCPYEVILIALLQSGNLWLTKIADCGPGVFQVLWAVHWRRMGRFQLRVSAPFFTPSKLTLKILSSLDLQFWYVNLPWLTLLTLFVDFMGLP